MSVPEQEAVPFKIKSARVWTEHTRGGAVQFGVGGSIEALSPDGARRLAAALMEHADLAEAGVTRG